MANTKYTEYSFSELIAEFVKLQGNALSIIEALSETAVGDNDYVTVSMETESGQKDYQLVSYNWMKQSVDRIDSTIELMLGLENSSATVRLPDGSYQKVYSYQIAKEPNDIGNLSVPTAFSTKSNYFFEDYLSPLLVTSFNLDDYLEDDYTRISMKRFLIDTSTEKSAIFFSGLKGKNNIEYDSFISSLITERIPYVEDEQIRDLPLSSFKYYGDFTVLKIEEGTVPVTSDLTQGTSSTANTLLDSSSSAENRTVDLVQPTDVSSRTTRFYQLDKLTYIDQTDLIEREKTLTIGDKLTTENSLFEIQTIDKDTNFISLKRLSGYDAIKVLQVDSLSLFSDTASPKTVDVNVSLNENIVIFFKSIDDDFNIENSKWSPGNCFAANELKITWLDNVYTLRDFYFKHVHDFSKVFISGATENVIPRIDAVKPAAPVLFKENFSIETVNEHKFNTKDKEAIRKKGASKIKLKSEIEQIGVSIEKKKQTLNTKKFNSDIEKKAQKNDLNQLMREKKSKTDLYSSTVQELAVVAKNELQTIPKPKFRIRGFFDIPVPTESAYTAPQNIVQFTTRYRYLKLDSSTPNAKQFEYADSTNQIKRASFTPWIEVKSPAKKKYFDSNVGKYLWAPENLESGDVVNINQIDISITSSEKVEIQVQSISEAGWPTNPELSDWSNTVTIEFTDDINVTDESEMILKEAVQEENIVAVQNMLQSEGVSEHLLSSSFVGEEYFPHTLEAVASGFFTSEGRVINSYEKIKQLEDALVTLRNTIEQVKGKLNVYVLDSDADLSSKTKISVQNNTVIKVFAGYYTDYINSLSSSEKKGAIINKLYKIVLENSETTPLELVSKLPGGLGENLPNTLNGNFEIDNDDYNQKRLYDQVPISNSSVSSAETKNGIKIRSSNLQSQQLLSQFAYTRFTDIGLKNTNYINPTTLSDRRIVPVKNASDGTEESYVWKWKWDDADTPTTGGVLNDFCVHTDYPFFDQLYARLSVDIDIDTNDVQEVYDGLMTPKIQQLNDEPVGELKYSEFRHSYYFDKLSTDIGGNKQLGYVETWNGITGDYASAPIGEYPDKLGFVEGDRYLIGSKTCGSYLFVAPQTLDNLLVDGTDYLAKRTLEQGESNAITIPIIFQFRMEDYFGTDDRGITGGFKPDTVEVPENLTYAKKIGLDIFLKDETPFSFDIEVTAKYTKQALVEKVTPDDLAKTTSVSRETTVVTKADLKQL